MNDLIRLIDPRTIAIVGLSANPDKHGSRVLTNLQNLGFPGEIWGVNPSRPDIKEVGVFGKMSDLPEPPDLVICAIPAAAVSSIIRDCDGVGAAIVFAGGFGESGPQGLDNQNELSRLAQEMHVRLLGPNSGGVICPSHHLAASFLTCLDRPAVEIRSGPVGLVTQSGGIGSFLHNLAAERQGGLAISIATGNEADIEMGEALATVAGVDTVDAIVVVLETVRDGASFIGGIRDARARGKPVVACRLGSGDRARALMTSHTGALAVSGPVLDGVLESLGVVIAETPAEALDVAELLARAGSPTGARAAIVTHSGGTAIMLADRAERHRLVLETPSPQLKARVKPLLDHGTVDNPVDMGGIIGGPHRFAEVVGAFADSGEYDIVLAVTTAHSPNHSEERAASLLGLTTPVSIVHLWMAGDQARTSLRRLREAGRPVTEDPRAAILGIAALARSAIEGPATPLPTVSGAFDSWGLPLLRGTVVGSPTEAIMAAESIGYPVALKVHSAAIAHKTEHGGVKLNLGDAAGVRVAFSELMASIEASGHMISEALLQKYTPGIEVIVGAIHHEIFGPIVSVGFGGVFAELVGDVVFAIAPVNERQAAEMIDSLKLRAGLDDFRKRSPADVDELARIVSIVSRGLVGSGLQEIEINPLIWAGHEWIAVDWLIVADGVDQSPNREMTVR